MKQQLNITLALSDSNMGWDLTIKNPVTGETEHHTELTGDEARRHVQASLQLSMDAIIETV
jgi:hypothetical protein